MVTMRRIDKNMLLTCFIKFSLTKSNHHPTNRKRTFFSNALRGIGIKEGIKYSIRPIETSKIKT